MNRFSPHIPGRAQWAQIQGSWTPRCLRQTSQRRGMDEPLPYLDGTIYPKKLAKQNKVTSHKCLTLKNNINPTYPTSWTLSHPKALCLPKIPKSHKSFWFLSVKGLKIPMGSHFFKGILLLSVQFTEQKSISTHKRGWFLPNYTGRLYKVKALLAENKRHSCMEKLLSRGCTLPRQKISSGSECPWSITSVLRQKCCEPERKLQLPMVFIH